MNFEITARHASVSEDVKRHAREKVEQVLKHADGLTSVHVILDAERERQMAEIIVHGRNLSATVHADSTDIWTSIDRCALKLKHQLDHHEGRQREKRRRQPGLAQQEAELVARSTILEVADELPRLVRLPIGDVRPMSAEAARHQLQNSELEYVVFLHEEANFVCVMVRRTDGSFGLIETGEA
jgi:putative sigma-54 modulation protein